MRKSKQLDTTNHTIWKDKKIKPETKDIYLILYAQGFDKKFAHINIGEIQGTLSITNVGFKNNLKILEENNYITYKEYDKGLYEFTIC